jgi:cAMP-specific phosphodiesterase 4
MHSAYYLLASTPAGNLFTSLEILAILTAGLCHDVDHTGRTNAFEISKETDLAILYSDIAVLENHHAATAFFLLNKAEYNIFSALTRDDRKLVRKLMIETILATDMSKHFPTIEELKTRFMNLEQNPIGTLDDDKVKVAELIIHASDLCNPTKEYAILS